MLSVEVAFVARCTLYVLDKRVATFLCLYHLSVLLHSTELRHKQPIQRETAAVSCLIRSGITKASPTSGPSRHCYRYTSTDLQELAISTAAPCHAQQQLLTAGFHSVRFQQYLSHKYELAQHKAAQTFGPEHSRSSSSCAQLKNIRTDPSTAAGNPNRFYGHFWDQAAAENTRSLLLSAQWAVGAAKRSSPHVQQDTSIIITPHPTLLDTQLRMDPTPASQVRNVSASATSNGRCCRLGGMF